jgi:hypothetical protein
MDKNGYHEKDKQMNDQLLSLVPQKSILIQLNKI